MAVTVEKDPTQNDSIAVKNTLWTEIDSKLAKAIIIVEHIHGYRFIYKYESIIRY